MSVVALQKSMTLTLPWWCKTGVCYTADREDTLNIRFILTLQCIGAWLNSFWVLIWKCCFCHNSPGVLVPLCMNMSGFPLVMSCLTCVYFVVKTTASITLWSIKETLFIILLHCFCRYHTKLACSSISMRAVNLTNVQQGVLLCLGWNWKNKTFNLPRVLWWCRRLYYKTCVFVRNKSIIRMFSTLIYCFWLKSINP